MLVLLSLRLFIYKAGRALSDPPATLSAKNNVHSLQRQLYRSVFLLKITTEGVTIPYLHEYEERTNIL